MMTTETKPEINQDVKQETRQEPKPFNSSKPEVKPRNNSKDKSNKDHAMFIGEKPFMNYVTGAVMQFTTKGASQVVIKARGKFISRAVDIAEVVSKRFLDNTVHVAEIKTDSEEFKNKEGKDVRVSSIEIVLRKK